MIWVYAAGVLAFLFVLIFIVRISNASPGTQQMRTISASIQEGALTFLRREYTVISAVALIIFCVLALFISFSTALSYLAGACLSGGAGFIGMRVATKANARTTEAAKSGLDRALQIAFSSGAVMGLSVVGLGLLGVALLYTLFKSPIPLFGFSLGASSIALFARVGGGIFTKAADVGADLVGKVEKGIPEDDPRNPAVIADNVGDNVGDVAGMGADLYESYVGSLIAAMALGATAFGTAGVLLPLHIAAIGIAASVLGTLFVRGKGNPEATLRRGVIAASLFLVLGAFLLIKGLFGTLELFYVIVTGLIAGVLIGLITEHYTSKDKKHAQEIAKAAQAGPAANVIQGLAVGMKSTTLPVIVIVTAIYLSYLWGGVYGVALAAVGMLSTLGISLAVDAYGPVADNAGGIAEMSHQNKKVRTITDALDAAGNTTAATGKGFAIGGAALTALAFFSTYVHTTGLRSIDLLDHRVMIGMLLGGMLPFLFSALTMQSVGKAAFSMIEEVRRQFKTKRGLLSGKDKPDYATCVDISTQAALREMIIPACLAILSPLVLGFLLGAEAAGGMLAGSLVSGVLLALFMANSGGAWDNAKKYIEAGAYGGKGSESHKAAVVGDTVGDPCKDTSGPSLNILIKLMAIIALVFAPLFL